MQNWKKWCVFGHIDKFWKGHDGQIKKNACKNTYLGSIFIPEKYEFRVCFESFFYEDDIQPEKQVVPLPAERSSAGLDPLETVFQWEMNCAT